MSLPIIIDTDPGIDDAAAIALALSHTKFDVKMISTVNGNVGVEKTTANALKLKAFFNSEVPIHRGASQPLISEIQDASHIHGESGMDGYQFPTISTSDLASSHAVEAMNEILSHSNEPITLVTLGPLTNIALLFNTYPECKNHVKEIIMMGGSTGRGNVTPLAEFNIYCDPEAAHIVFNAGLPLTMIGLDLARQSLFTHSYLNTLKDKNNTTQMLYHIFQHYRGEVFKEGIKLYDAFTILYLLDPKSYEIKEADVQIELQGSLTRGATVVDFESSYPNCSVVVSSINEHYKTIFLNTLKN
ncbi:ribonucleoside hydrolase RihC [Staphylococcus hominis]|uniref:ribonucleoside hydrolase RihC n=1 Tax=Staphylococcus hominis TaxID=1290 RepID=UPI0008FB6750|nr:ribonucleoside hydrolase RihC [Staphylococcus hominis]KAF1682113.1 ribonucleoside hydrolase RihC [Staphylococcus hominis]OIS44284.1 ribonucleoside hydrolase RihC [Staphylococcus hominis]OIS49113.1 ribonucleoside hydrolase RihC [Staphylococcus hominis]OIS50696.1 ribonucleoside hydrolase RihC [Staphylococcus hominis]